jgi:DNA invertase Pin-like site-specific DNA recombinase
MSKIIPKRTIGYARVSSTEQSYGSSLDDQQDAIEAYAKTRSVRVTRFYVESEGGGREKIEKREQMQALMNDIRSGDLVLCDKIDRWSRDPEFTYQSLRTIREAGAHFYAVADQIDPSTAEGDTQLNFRVLFAREEHKRIKLRMVGTRNILRERGYYVEGTPPFGYRRAKPRGFKGVEKNILVIEPGEANVVRLMFRLAARGQSQAQISETLGVAKKRVWSSLRCRTYLGEIRTSRGWIKGPHEPIITAARFDLVREAIDSRLLWAPRPRTAPSETSSWIFRSLARCAQCGGKMGAAYAGEKGADRRHYYRCLARCAGYVRVRPVEDLIEALILERLKELREELASGPALALAPIVLDFASKLHKLVARRERLLARHEDGLTTMEELRTALARVDGDRLKLTAQHEAASRVHDPAVRRSMLREITSLRRAWVDSSVENKRAIATMLMSGVRIGANQAPSPTWYAVERLVRT